MTLQYLKGKRIVGLSSDAKPTVLPSRWQSADFLEKDSGRKWSWSGGKWNQNGFTEEVKDILYKRYSEGSPLIRLIGDEFARNAESSLYLLEDLTSKIGGGVLTNNASIIFAEDNDIPLRGFLVPTLDGTTQFFSRATEAQFEVGTGSFIASIWFKTSATGLQHIFAYGDTAASEQEWRLFFDANNKVGAQVDDGTAVASVLDSRGDIYNDGKWHHGILFWDAGTALKVYVDGRLIGTETTGLPTLTLNNVGESFYIGVAENVTTKTNFFNGQLANFHLIKAADYNALQVLNQGIREKVVQGSPSLTIGASARLSSTLLNSSSVGDYITTIIDVEEGNYDVFTIYRQNTGFTTQYEVLIDGIVVQTINMDGTSTFNLTDTVSNIKLSAGKHILKLKSTTAGAFQIFWLNIIKREGHERDGATKFLLLGDEINQRNNNAWTIGTDASAFYNNAFLDATTVTGEFFEGDLFIKGGLYKIEYTADGGTNRAAYNLHFGNSKVLDEDTRWDGGVIVNQTEVMFVRLQQGKQTVRFECGSTITGAVTQMFSIRGERISD